MFLKTRDFYTFGVLQWLYKISANRQLLPAALAAKYFIAQYFIKKNHEYT